MSIIISDIVFSYNKFYTPWIPGLLVKMVNISIVHKKISWRDGGKWLTYSWSAYQTYTESWYFLKSPRQKNFLCRLVEFIRNNFFKSIPKSFFKFPKVWKIWKWKFSQKHAFLLLLHQTLYIFKNSWCQNPKHVLVLNH